jgi:cation transport protein ChaC
LPATRTLALTPAHVARVHRPMDDPGPPPGRARMTDEDYLSARETLMAAHPEGATPADLWLFVYGSLIWKPACDVVEQRPGYLAGWHRKFCFRINRYRGCDEQPGLMMALDRGGACRGVLQRLPPGRHLECLDQLLRREFSYKPWSQRAAWLRVRSEGRSLPALAFVMNHRAPTYSGDLTLEQQADLIARACGHVGSCAEYLMNTVAHLEQLGIHDRYLWRLQQLVAERIGAMD